MSLMLKRKGSIITTASILFNLLATVTSFAGTVNYIYDDLNRLIQERREDQTVIEYTYDEIKKTRGR